MSIEDRISEYMDDDLPEDRRRELHRALNDSPESRELFRKHVALDGFARDRRMFDEPTDVMQTRLYARLQREEEMPAAIAREALGGSATVPAPFAALAGRRWGLVVYRRFASAFAIVLVCALVACVFWWALGPKQDGVATNDRPRSPRSGIASISSDTAVRGDTDWGREGNAPNAWDGDSYAPDTDHAIERRTPRRLRYNLL